MFAFSNFEEFAYYLVEVAKNNHLKSIREGTHLKSFEIDEEVGDFKAIGSILQYMSNFQNKLVNLDKDKRIVYFDQFRLQTPVFISKIREQIETKMMRFLIENGIPANIKPSGFSIECLQKMVFYLMKKGILYYLDINPHYKYTYICKSTNSYKSIIIYYSTNLNFIILIFIF